MEACSRGGGEDGEALAGQAGRTGGAGRGWQLAGHEGWLGASLLALATAPGGTHQPHVNTSHRQLNHLCVSGLQSQWERLRREVLISSVGS